MKNMAQFLVFFCIIFSILIIPKTLSKCVHDDLPKGNNLIQDIKYGDIDNGRVKRAPRELYKPIRIHPVFALKSYELTPLNKTAIKNAVNQATSKIQKILSVIPVKGNLILKRSACLLTWSDGPNKNRCFKPKKGYGGELCLDHYRIPKMHLEGLYLYNKTYDKPFGEVYQPGSGVEATDFILYITSQTTATCQYQENEVYGYASSCQEDQNGRPIAGVVNFCPEMFFKHHYFTDQHLYTTALHEIFHALGFSKSLFPKFKDCSKSNDGMNCPMRSKSVYKTVDGITRLATPNVIEKTKQHFSCYTELDFGGPLVTQNDVVTSHWDSAMMQGSLMTSDNTMPELTVLDTITLAVFEDSGWYKVDYSQADRYYWGKDGGCKFGLKQYCDIQTPYFCYGNARGCHYLGKNKGVCKTDSNIKPCKIFTPTTPEDQCIKPYGVRYSNVYGETFSETSRCFTSSLYPRSLNTSDLEPVGRCYEHRCLEPGHVQIKINHSEWIDCFPGASIEISKFSGSVECPSNPDILCSEEQLVTSTAALTQSTTYRIRNPDFEAIPIKIFFSQDNLTQLIDRTFLSYFETAFIRKVISVIPVSRDRIENFTADPENNTVTFWLKPPTLYNNISSEDVEYQLELTVLNGQFWVHVVVDGKNNTFYANGISNRSEISIWLHEKKMYNKGHGVRSDMVIGTIIGSIVFVALAIFVFVMLNRKTNDVILTPSGSSASVSASPATPRLSPFRKNRAHGAQGGSPLPSIEENREFIQMEIDDSQTIEALV